MKLTLALICKDETKELETCFNSVKKYIDEISVAWTGSNPGTLDILNKYNCKVTPCNPKTHPQYFFQKGDEKYLNVGKESFKVGALKNFAGARNVSFKHASNPLVLWIDADDTFEGAEKIPEFIDYFKEDHRLGALWFFYDYSQNKYGETDLSVWRERIIRKDWFEWIGYVHEENIKKCSSVSNAIGEEYAHVKHHTSGERRTGSGYRNLVISEYWYNREKEENKLDPLSAWNVAKSLNAIGAYKEALKAFEEFVQITKNDQHRYDGYIRIADLTRNMKMYDYALDAGVQALKLRPTWPFAYFNLGTTSFVMDNFDNCIYYTYRGYDILEKYGDPSKTMPMAFDPTSITWVPLQPLAMSLTQTARWQEALEVTNKALQFVPKNEFFNNYLKLIPKEIERENLENNCLNIYNHLRKNEEHKLENFSKIIPKIAETLPPFIRLKNQYRTDEGWENKVVIYCGSGYEYWDPKSAESGIGGSEEAVINISRYLAQLGWNVEVYNNCLEEGNYDGVLWQAFEKHDKSRKCKIFVAWRNSEYLNFAPDGSYKCFWLHDVWQGDYSSLEELKMADKIFVLSEWHKTNFEKAKLPDDKFFVTRNGILPSQFMEKIKRDPLSCIYASSPDRGLDILLAQWPEIIKAVPEARLNVYYGFTENYDKVHANDSRMMLFKEEVMKKLDDLKDSVKYHGRVGHMELARAFLANGLWVYPTCFTETSCITSMKSQVAGCVPITDTLAALKETTQFGVKVQGAMDNPENLKKWTGYVIDFLKNPKKQEEIRPAMRKWAKEHFAWATVTKEWSELFKGIK